MNAVAKFSSDDLYTLFFSIFVQPLPANLVVPSGTFRYDSFSLLACLRWKKRQVPIDYHISVLFVILWLFLELEKKLELKNSRELGLVP